MNTKLRCLLGLLAINMLVFIWYLSQNSERNLFVETTNANVGIAIKVKINKITTNELLLTSREVFKKRNENITCAVANHAQSSEIWQPMQSDGICSWKLLRFAGLIEDYSNLSSENSALPSLQCLFEFRRFYSVSNGEIDLFPLGGQPQQFTYLPHINTSRMQSASIKWCADRQKWIGCRTCGYSCNQFSKFVNEDVELEYPIKTSVRLVLDRSNKYIKDDCYLRFQNEFNGTGDFDTACQDYPILNDTEATVESFGSRKLLSKYKLANPFRFRLFGKTQDQAKMMLTAGRMGFRTIWRPSSEFPYASCKGRTRRELTFFFGRRIHRKLVSTNIGHWLHDNYFPMFSTIHSYVNLLSGERQRYRVVAIDDAWQYAWKQTWAVGPLGYLLEAIAPKRPILVYKTCYTNAIFDCPKANSMAPMEYLQKWLEFKHQMSFSPIPDIVDQQRVLLLMLRRSSSSRSIENYKEMISLAEQRQWNVSVPLHPSNSSIYGKMIDILPILQTTSLLVGFHGAELSPMIFMPRYSVVIEIVPLYFKYLDGWYIHQANASSHHLIRWSPTNSSLHYGPSWESSDAYSRNKRYEDIFYSTRKDFNRIHEFGARSMRSGLRASMDEWSQLLQISEGILKNDGMNRTRHNYTQ